MKIRTRILLSALILLVPALGQAQALEESDPLLRVVELSQQVYFDGADDAPLLVPAGDFWVDTSDGALRLAALDGQSDFTIAASSGVHEEQLVDTMALSFSGGEEQPDAFFVSLMAPDGQQLTAQGSYSGVQDRGALSEARKRAQAAAAAVAAARKRAAEKARKAAAARAKQAKALAQQAAAAAGQAVETVGEAAGNVVETIQEAIPDAPFAELIAAANQLGVQDLLACLKDARDSRQGNIGSMATEFANDPASAVQSLQADIRQSVDAHIGDFSTALDGLGENPGPAEVTDAAFDLFMSVADEKPAVGCLMTLIEPKLAQMKRDIIRKQEAVLAKAQQTVNEKVIPALLGDVQDKVAEFALGRDIPSGIQTRGIGSDLLGDAAMHVWQKQGMASGLYMQSMTIQYNSASDDIADALSQSVPDLVAIRAAVESVETMSDDDMRALFSIGMMRYRGHRAIDSSSGVLQKLISKSERLEAFGRRIAIKIVGGVCGLVPEAGAAICNAAFVPVEAIAIFVVQQTVKKIIEVTLHTTWGVSVDAYAHHIATGSQPSDPGPFYFALRQLDRNDVQAAAEADLPPGFTEAFENYNATLAQVLDSWEAERAATP